MINPKMYFLLHGMWYPFGAFDKNDNMKLYIFHLLNDLFYDWVCIIIDNNGICSTLSFINECLNFYFSHKVN